MAVVVVAMLLSGCGGGGAGGEERTDRALKAILKEYGPRFEQRRTALAAAASRLSKDRPGKGSRDRKADPRPDFQPFDHKGLVLDNYNSPDQGGNVDIASVGEADTPERIADDPGWKLCESGEWSIGLHRGRLKACGHSSAHRVDRERTARAGFSSHSRGVCPLRSRCSLWPSSCRLRTLCTPARC
ncbi:hypothetical protein ABZ636_00290 [Streptomyces sp. NPDC007251]|uniref:hypothetical protein n=1 Tax=unclassified Streptomyces TaxID=2593676 RepID=UPI0033E31B88